MRHEQSLPTELLCIIAASSSATLLLFRLVNREFRCSLTAAYGKEEWQKGLARVYQLPLTYDITE
eukprot:6214593-Pleurochrysis_carterae.AAC.10